MGSSKVRQPEVWISLLFVGFYLLGGVVGFQLRQYQLTTNQHTYRHVLIVERVSDAEYRVWPAQMNKYDWTFCSPVKLDVGRELCEITYEQRLGCKDVRGLNSFIYDEGECEDARRQSTTSAGLGTGTGR